MTRPLSGVDYISDGVFGSMLLGSNCGPFVTILMEKLAAFETVETCSSVETSGFIRLNW